MSDWLEKTAEQMGPKPGGGFKYMEKRREGMPGREMTWAVMCGKNARFRGQ